MSTPKNPSVMNHSFSKIPAPTTPRSTFNRSNGYKTTFDGGYLIPVRCDEIIPGDTVNLNMAGFARFNTPIKPLMDNIYLDSQFFFVPMRLIWDNWYKFMGAQDDPGDSTSFVIPQMVSPASVGHLVGSLSDYMTIPTDIPLLTHSTMWHRAYNLVYNAWYRDENLINSVTVDKDNGPDTSTDYTLLRRGKRKDYFTSALPWPQKGTEVTIPLGTYADVEYTPASVSTNSFLARNVDTDATVGNINNFASNGSAEFYGVTGPVDVILDPNGRLRANLATATASTINALRLASQTQKVFETDARGGTRLTEMIRAHFGVVSDDARMQRPEYLGGGSLPLNMTQVPQTSESSAGNPLGGLSAFATAIGSLGGFTKSFTEHGILLGIVSARADLNYQQGLARMFSRSTRFDFYLPLLANIGEQAILNKEIWADASANDELVFGYQERWAEMRYKPSSITGLYRSDASGTLDVWHSAQDFATLPVLNETFINDTPPFDRNVFTPADPHFQMDLYFTETWARIMPTYSVPGAGITL